LSRDNALDIARRKSFNLRQCAPDLTSAQLDFKPITIVAMPLARFSQEAPTFVDLATAQPNQWPSWMIPKYTSATRSPSID
jgi:hypothetical protein